MTEPHPFYTTYNIDNFLDSHDSSEMSFGFAREVTSPQDANSQRYTSIARTAPVARVLDSNNNSLFVTKNASYFVPDGFSTTTFREKKIHPCLGDTTGVCCYMFNRYDDGVLSDTNNPNEMPGFNATYNSQTGTCSLAFINNCILSVRHDTRSIIGLYGTSYVTLVPLLDDRTKIKGIAYDTWDSKIHLGTNGVFSNNPYNDDFWHNSFVTGNNFSYFYLDKQWWSSNNNMYYVPSAWAVVQAIGWRPGALSMTSLESTSNSPTITSYPNINSETNDLDIYVETSSPSDQRNRRIVKFTPSLNSSYYGFYYNAVELGDGYYFLWTPSLRVTAYSNTNKVIIPLPSIGGFLDNSLPYGLYGRIIQYGVEFNRYLH